MKKRLRVIIAAILGVLSLMTFCFGITACRGSSKSSYYLSVDGATYSSIKDVPKEYVFSRSGDIHTLTVELNKGEAFTVNKAGTDEKIGLDALFTARKELTQGENNVLVVGVAGTYTITLDLSDGTDITYSVARKKANVEIMAPVTEMFVEDTYPFMATVIYTDGTTDMNVTWSTNNVAVVSVSSDGYVSALAVGTATITATAGDVSDSVEITVSEPLEPVTGVTLDPMELTLEFGSTAKLNANVLPANADNKNVFWDTSASDVVTIANDGTVTAVGYGTAKITVTTASRGFTAECRITVIKHVSSVKLSASTLKLVKGGAAKELSVGVLPSDASVTDYTYQITSGSGNIAVTDNERGTLKLTGIAVGTATIKITSTDNPDAYATCNIEVLAEGSAIADMRQNVQVTIGAQATLEVTLENAEINTVAWSVASEAVATVTGNNETATVTGVDFGSTTITATVTDTDSQTYTVTCKVLVAEEYYFIYGYGLGAYDWDYQDYVTDRNAAANAGILFDEVSTGLYRLTRHLTPNNGFQIIFPNVANYTAADGTWNKNMPSANVATSEYFDSSRSDSALISNATDQFKVNAAGVYTIYLDLTGESAKVYIKNVSVDITSISLAIKSGSALLRKGDSVTLSIAYSPNKATFIEDDVQILLSSLYAAYGNYVDYELNFADKTITLTVKADPPTEFTLTVNCSINGIEGTFDLIIYPANKQETPVTSIAFEEEEYAFNVNNGGKDWAQTVEAKVNADATIQGVKYSIVESTGNFAVNDAGVVTATRLGTVTIKATAVGNENMTAFCTVTFYSDTFYLSGEFNDSKAFDSLDQSMTTVEGTAFEKYAFTMVSYTYFTLEVELEQLKQVGTRDEYGFQIIHLGINEQWTSALTVGMRNVAGCYNADTYFSIHDRNMRVLITGTYFIEIDLSGTSASWTINWKDTELQDILLTAKSTALKTGETTQIKLAFGPSFAARPESEVKWSITSGSKYLSVNFDYATLTATVAATSSEFSEDASATVTCKVGSLSKSVTFKIVAQHHLEWTWDDEAHFWACTDDGCDYTGERTAHKKTSGYVTNDPRGHYASCEECGIEYDFEAHSHTHDDDYWATGNESCDVCGFLFFSFSGTTLERCYGDFERVDLSGSNITTLGESAFEGNANLKEIKLPNPIQTGLTIGDKAFKDCISLEAISLPNAVTSIGSYAFTGTAVRITWGKSLRITELGYKAFYGYLGTSIEIPSSIKNLGQSCFAYSNLTSIVIPDTISYKTSYSGSNMFEGCTSLRSVVLGAKLDIIQQLMFRGCTALETVLIKGMTFWEIQNNAFRGCVSIKNVYILRPLSEILTCNWMFVSGNEVLKGHVWVYSEEDPGENPFGDAYSNYFGYFRDWYAGTWHWDESGKLDVDHILFWNTKAATVSYTLFFDDKRKEI